MRGRRLSLVGLMVSAVALVGFVLLASLFKQEAFLQRDLAFTQGFMPTRRRPLRLF